MPFAISNPSLARALAAKSYEEPTPVQAAVSDPALSGRNMLVSAQTGSGKTVAFGLAVAAGLLGDAERFGAPGAPLALVVAPTRELALQVQRELVWLYAETGARIVSCVGGMDPRREHRALMAGAHVVVGTPGRLRDHMERGNLDLSALGALVLDEADEMLNLGFREDLAFILDATPAGRQTLMFSATIPGEIARMARHYLGEDAARIEIAEERHGHADIDHRAVRIAPHEVEKAVVNVLRWFEARASIVFCATRDGVKKLHGALVERGFSAVALSGEMGQNERNQALQAVREGRARVCVATDVAARGIDVADLGLVIHADLPHDSEVLLHRSGRTGRAGRKGTSVMLVPVTRRRRAESLLAGAGIVASWSGAPTPDEIHRLDQERLLAEPVLTEEPTEEELVLAERVAEGRSATELAAALIRLYRARMPEPEELIDRAARTERREETEVAPAGRSVWFRLAIGRKDDADVRWILPLICRFAGITRRHVGAIRIADRETLFEVSAEVAGTVAAAAAAAAANPQDEEIRVELAGDVEPRVHPHRPPHKPKGKPKAHGKADGADRKPRKAKRKA